MKLTCREIGKIYGCSDGVVRKFMIQNNIKKRSRSDRAKMSLNHWSLKCNDDVDKIKTSISVKSKKYSIECFNEILEDMGYELLSEIGFHTEKIKLRCSHGHEWEATPHKILQGRGCPFCLFKNQTYVHDFLIEMNDIKVYREQFLCEYRYKNVVRRAIVDFIVDINNERYIIEYNGKQHYEPVCFGGITYEKAKENFERQKCRDLAVDEYCKNNNITIIWIDGRIIFGKEKIRKILMEKLK